MLPVALEDLLLHILPTRAGPDSKEIAKSFIVRLQFCILTSAMESHRPKGHASPSSAATNYIGRNINDQLFPRRTCGGRVDVRRNQRPGVRRCASMHLRRLDSRLCPDPSDVRNTDSQPDPHGSGGSAAAGITSSGMALTSGPVWRLYPWLSHTSAQREARRMSIHRRLWPPATTLSAHVVFVIIPDKCYDATIILASTS
eukprot:g8619.t1